MTTSLRRLAERMAEQQHHADAAQAALDVLTAPFEAAVRAALRTSFLAAYTRMGLTAAAGATASFSADDLGAIRTAWLAAVQGELLPMVAEVHATGALSVLLGYPDAAAVAAGARDLAAVVDARGTEYLAQAQNRLVGIGDTSWEGARSSLTEGMAAGEPVEDLAARLEHELDVSEVRAVTIARTEVVGAANAGSMDAVRILGGEGPTHKQWLATLGPRTRDSHAEADGQVVPVGDTFTVGGESLDYPGDPAGSAAEVVNCRCTVLFVDDPEATIADDRETGGPSSTTIPNDLAAAAAPHPHEETPMRITLPRSTRYRAARAAATAAVRSALTAAGVPDPVVHPVHGNVYPFTTLITVEGRWTGDERYVADGALGWDGMLPLPVTVPHDDDPRVTVGVVSEVQRTPGTVPGESLIVGTGFLDADHPLVQGTPDTPGLARQVAEGFVRGVSMDLDAPTIGAVDPATVPEGVQAEDADWLYTVVLSGRLRALAVTSLPAFPEAHFTLGSELPAAADMPPALDGPEPLDPDTPVDEEEDPELVPEEELPVAVLAAGTSFRVVAAQPVLADCPPREWFSDPHLDGPTPLTITDEGRVYGHLARWGVCHTGFDGTCIMAPRTSNGYASFLVGEEVCDNGERVPVGALTLGTGHAGEHLTARPAAAHYDDTGTRGAHVTIGEDRHGVWVAGAVLHSTTPEDVRLMRATPLSGDWRRIGTSLELVAALHVNTPGFLVPRMGLAASGRQVSLLSAGVVDPSTAPVLPRSAVERIAASIGRDYLTRARELRARVHGEQS